MGVFFCVSVISGCRRIIIIARMRSIGVLICFAFEGVITPIGFCAAIEVSIYQIVNQSPGPVGPAGYIHGVLYIIHVLATVHHLVLSLNPYVSTVIWTMFKSLACSIQTPVPFYF